MKLYDLILLSLCCLIFCSPPVSANDTLPDSIREITKEVKSLPPEQIKLSPAKLENFLQNLQKLTADMSQEKVERLLGKPDKVFTIGQVGFKARTLPDRFTFLEYELMSGTDPKRYYFVGIQFSKEKRKILNVYRRTNIFGDETDRDHFKKSVDPQIKKSPSKEQINEENKIVNLNLDRENVLDVELKKVLNSR